MPGIKELHYFNDRINEPKNPVSRLYGKTTGQRTVDRRWRRQAGNRIRRHLRRFSKKDFLWDLKYYAGTPNDEWYFSLFEPGRERVKGEITPAYSMLDRESIDHIHDLAPEAKLIFMMRNPIERAWSQVVMRFDKSGGKKADVVRRKQLRRHFESETSRLRTNYLRTLENWGAFYPEEQFFIGFLEDIYFYPEELLKSVYRFLGVDPSFKPEGIDEKVHSRSAGRMPMDPAVYLAGLYRTELSRLEEKFGGYASFWRYCAEKLAEDPFEEENLPYPLWESAIWKEWASVNSGKPGFQSGPLPSVQTA